ncbi:hypothetical protein WJX81_003057 [Elliptochloris bilobata]|uniref:Uncharacterized protein n=1 Tax=Elliptochloris bilobata TaxID=381761 RepID=A0AAW1S8H6_9CHLO
MGRKRELVQVSSSPASLEVSAAVLEPFLQQQASGEVCYGEGLLPPSLRVRSKTHSPALAYAQAVIDAAAPAPPVFHPRLFLSASQRQSAAASAAAVAAGTAGLQGGSLLPWGLGAARAVADGGPPTHTLQIAYAAEAARQRSHLASLPAAQARARATAAPSSAATWGRLGSMKGPPGPHAGRCVGREGGDARVAFSGELRTPSPRNTVQRAHGLASLQGVRFYQSVSVADPDSPGAHFGFDLADAAHAACFNVGVGPDGGTLISWSPLHALYALPDGSAWAEHSNLWDVEDLASQARARGRHPASVVPSGAGPQELYRRPGRFHSRLQNVEYECWVHERAMPPAERVQTPEDNTYFVRSTFDPDALRVTPD